MNIIIHIGQSKTGTTALQTSLSRNRNILAEHKILYPDVYLKGKSIQAINHNPFIDSFGSYLYYPYLSADEYWEQFMSQFSSGSYDTMLLSGESFFGGRPYIWEVDGPEGYYARYTENLHRLKKYVGNSNVTIIGYLRPQIEWLESAIPHIIRYEGTLGRRVYENDEQLMRLLEPSMNYKHLIDLWEKIIKPQNVKLRPYDRKRFPKQNVIIDFLQQLGLDDARLEESHPFDNSHDSWSREFIEIKKTINETKRTRIQEDAIIDTINYLDKKYGSRQKYHTSLDIKEKVHAYYEKSNEQLSQKYNAGKPFFPVKKEDINNEKEISEEQIIFAKNIYDTYKKSWNGRKIMIVALIRRTMKKTSPVMFSMCSRIWKKVKKSSIRAY